jgi:gamma-butyrobetaine dioxygenase
MTAASGPSGPSGPSGQPGQPGPLDPVALLADLFTGEGARDYLGEAVSVAAHMLQAAGLAEAAGAPRHLVAAALLHDVGHFQGDRGGHDLMAGRDNRHGETGAAWLGQWFPDEVTEPVRLHVEAKRYLCATAAGYIDTLSAASAYTLTVQGGPMSPAEIAAFETLPHAEAAVAVRRWDDGAKDPDASAQVFEHFRPLLAGLVRP